MNEYGKEEAEQLTKNECEQEVIQNWGNQLRRQQEGLSRKQDMVYAEIKYKETADKGS